MSVIGSDVDSLHLARAIELAQEGRGQVSPNPLVGVVLADRETVIGEGFHRAVSSAHAGVEAIRAAAGQDLEPARVRDALGQLGVLGITSILLEGGPHLAGAFLDAGEIDEIRLFLAPLILGGRTARDPFEGEGVDAISDAVRATDLRCERVGDDLLVSARLREW